MGEVFGCGRIFGFGKFVCVGELHDSGRPQMRTWQLRVPRRRKARMSNWEGEAETFVQRCTIVRHAPSFQHAGARLFRSCDCDCIDDWRHAEGPWPPSEGEGEGERGDESARERESD